MSSRRRTRSTEHTLAQSEGVVRQPIYSQDERTHLVDVLGVSSPIRVVGSPDEAAAAVASVQRGRVTRWQLRACGLSEDAIEWRLRRGWLHRAQRGVYVLGHLAPVPLAFETESLLACGPGAVLSHTSAARIWKLPVPAGGGIHVTITRPRIGRLRGVTLHRSRLLTPRDVRIRERLPVTTPAWTLLDLAGILTPRDLERALDEALVILRIVRSAEIRNVLARANGRREASMLRRLLDQRTNSRITHSEAERRCLELIRSARLPLPETQVEIAGYKVDLLWPTHQVVFEIDGFTYHRSRSAFDRDRRKDLALKAAGLDPNRVSRDQVVFEPAATIAAIAGALARSQAAS